VTAKKLVKIKELFGRSMRMEIIRLENNSGPAAARNAGWDTATQPYIVFLDADDAWHPGKIDIQYRWMEKHSDIALTGHPCLLMQEDASAAPLSDALSVHDVGKTLLLFSNRFQTSSVMLRREIPYRFQQGMNYCEDYLLWLRIVLNGNKACRINLPLAFLFKPPFGRGGLSGNVWLLSKGEMNAIRTVSEEGLISGSARLFFTVYIFLKYMRRFGISLFSRRLFSGSVNGGTQQT
jgi:glycosyltransferase involved in cell wall biosynthesis